MTSSSGRCGGRGDRDVELVADVARQVLGGRHELAAGGVVVDELAERVARLVGRGAQQRRDLLEVDAAVGLDADGERVVGGVDAEHRRARDEGALREHRGRHRGLRRLVEALKRHDERRERVAAQRVHDARRDARDARLSGGVGATGRAGAEAVDRPVAGRVGAVAVAQLCAQPVGLVGVLDAGGLGLQQRLGAVAQAEQRLQLDALAGRDLGGRVLAAEHAREAPVRLGGQVAVPQPGRGRERGPLGGDVAGGPLGHRQPGAVCAGGDVVQGAGEVLVDGRVGQRADLQGGRAVLAGGDGVGAEHVVGVLVEVGVDAQVAAVVQAQRPALLPGGRRGLAVGLAAAQDQQVGDDLRAGGALVRAGRQAHGADEVGHRVDLAACGGVLRVQRVAAGQYGDDAARARQRERLDDAVVVQRYLRRARMRHRCRSGYPSTSDASLTLGHVIYDVDVIRVLLGGATRRVAEAGWTRRAIAPTPSLGVCVDRPAG